MRTRERVFMIGLAVMASVLWLIGLQFNSAAALSTSEAEMVTAESDAVALTLTVGAQPLTMTMPDLQTIGRLEVHTELKGEALTVEGVPLRMLLAQLNLPDAATTLALTGADGYQALVSLADLRACGDCVLAWEGDSLRTVLPGMATRLWVQDVVKMEVY